MQRINVVGTRCSGRTTLARAIADPLRLPHVEFDALYWGPDWRPMPTPLVRERLVAALSTGEWVADGAYSDYRDITWGVDQPPSARAAATAGEMASAQNP